MMNATTISAAEPVLTTRNSGMPQATMITVPRMYTGLRPILSVHAPNKVVAKMPIAAAIMVAVSVTGRAASFSVAM